MKMLTKTLVLVSILSGACTLAAKSFPYRVIVVNLSNETIEGNKVIDSSGSSNYGGGIVVSYGYKCDAGPMDTPPNDIFTVRWTDEKKATHEQKFDLREKVKRGFKGEIVFVYGADRKFSVEICAEQRQYPIPQKPKP